MAVQISISVDEDLLKIIDKRAEKEHIGRSEAIRKMLRESIKKAEERKEEK